MRPLTRQGVRLASSCQARTPSVTRQRVDGQRRAFHITSSQRSSEPRAPNGTDSHSSANEWKDTQKSAEGAAQKHDESTELENGEVKAGGELRKGRTRTTLRQRRINEVPKPPPTPAWFLKHNVRLVEEREARGKSDAGDEEVYSTIRCVDNESGHTLFSIRHYIPLQPESSKAPGRGPGPEQSEGFIATAKKSTDAIVQPQFFDQKHAQAQQSDIAKSTDELLGSSQQPGQPYDRPRNPLSNDWYSHPIIWPFLEAETSARAALSLVNENQPLYQFATDRVDLSLQCPDPNSHEQMEEFVYDLAHNINADVIRLDANDLADLSGDYVGQGDDTPGSFSNLGYEVFEGFEAAKANKKSNSSQRPQDEDDENDIDEDDMDEAGQHSGGAGGFGSFLGIEDLNKALQSISTVKGIGGRIVGVGIGGSQLGRHNSLGYQQHKHATHANSSETNRDDARLSALFENLLNAASEKRAAIDTSKDGQSVVDKPRIPEEYYSKRQKRFRPIRADPHKWQKTASEILLAYLSMGMAGGDPTKFGHELFYGPPAESSRPEASARSTFVYVRDLQDICDSRLGENVIRRLSKAVAKRRRMGERILIVGTTAQDVAGPFPVSGDDHDDFPFRTITVPPCWMFNIGETAELREAGIITGLTSVTDPRLYDAAYNRIVDINLRHIQSMLRRTRPEDEIDMCSPTARKQMNLPDMHFLGERVLSLDQVQRLVLTAIGLSQAHAKGAEISPIHIALAAFVISQSDAAVKAAIKIKEKREAKKIRSENSAATHVGGGQTNEGGQARIERIKKSCNPHETRLLTGVVDAEKIKTGFNDVHAVPETIEALKTATSLSLLRPDAFKYGVLANDRLPGLLLYGPPGTGKTLLAKAVAKESNATVLEVSGAQIYEKYVGEGEKMVRAVFSLAKKLSPCVVFIDEADAIFGSRSHSSQRTTHREIINQFLREWDGMDDHGCFMMVATNRPFDLDDAVLRRLPRRLLVDLPVPKDRESILGIHLRNELLDSSVSLAKLAEQTPFYSGSDLKNLSVAAALACVREENELAEIRKEDTEFKFPEKRTLTLKHFDTALSEVSASISEDMRSLQAIRKFDEQYGDRKGRRKKSGYGFGVEDGAVNESSARVRQDSSSSPPAP